MASQLLNLFRTLSWSDFPTRQTNAPQPGDPPADAAATLVNVNPTGLSLTGSPPNLQLADTILVTIAFDSANSYKNSWVMTMSAAFQANMLVHEQGHYNLTALLARDFFLQLMAMKRNGYASAAAMQSDLNAAQAATVVRAQEISDDYDTGTSHGADPVGQATWNGYITTAFNQAVTPPQTAADGTSIKVKLIDVLSGAGAI
jgi:hypothetical protein